MVGWLKFKQAIYITWACDKIITFFLKQQLTWCPWCNVIIFIENLQKSARNGDKGTVLQKQDWSARTQKSQFKGNKPGLSVGQKEFKLTREICFFNPQIFRMKIKKTKEKVNKEEKGNISLITIFYNPRGGDYSVQPFSSGIRKLIIYRLPMCFGSSVTLLFNGNIYQSLLYSRKSWKILKDLE